MKKIISVILMVAMLFGTIDTFAAFEASESDMISLLSELKIMSGDPNGDMRLNDNVTRAEFTKMAIAASKYRNSVANNLNISPYKDVPYTHWAAPYVKLAVSNGICKGYPDGSFKPDNMVTFEEAVTMLLNVLGYTDDDFGISWPYGQVGMAANLEMIKNIHKGIGDILTRRDVSIMICNTLDIKQKGTQYKLINEFDCEIKDDVIIIASDKEDPSVNSSKIVTSIGTFDVDNFNMENMGRKGSVVLKNGEKIISFSCDEQIVDSHEVTGIIGMDMVLNGNIIDIDENMTTYYKSQRLTYSQAVSLTKMGDKAYVYKNTEGAVQYIRVVPELSGGNIGTGLMEKHIVYSMLGNNIVTYKGNVMYETEIADKTPAFEDNIQSTYGAIKSKMQLGDIVYIKRDKNGDIDYISYEKGDVKGPYTNTGIGLALDFDDDTVFMRNGLKVSQNDIELYDIVYYVRDLNMVFVYSCKVTGIYEKANPNKDFPSSVVISGATYEIESADAFKKLSSQGNFEFGDTVTLLMGKDGKVADVISPSQTNSEIFGYVLETGRKEYVKNDNTKYTGFYVSLALSDGKVYEYITDKDYKDYKNSVVQVTFRDGKAKVTSYESESGISGVFDWQDRTLGSAMLSDNIDIIDVSTLSENDPGMFISVFPQRIDGVRLSVKSIVHAGRDGSGRINSLILNDVTGDMYKYGIVTKAQSLSAGINMSGIYTYDINGVSYDAVTNSSSFNVKKGDPAIIKYDKNNMLSLLKSLTYLNENIYEVTQSYIMADGKKYLLSDKTVVYKVEDSGSYTLIPSAELEGESAYRIKAYYDKSEEAGGRIRILVASSK